MKDRLRYQLKNYLAAICALGVLLAAVALGSSSASGESNASPWLRSGDPTIQTMRDNARDIMPFRVSGNRPCYNNQKVVIVPAYSLYGTIFNEVSTTGCLVYTTFGAVDTVSGRLLATGSNVGGIARPPAGTSHHTPIMAPRGSHGIVETGDGVAGGRFMAIASDVRIAKTEKNPITQEVTHTLAYTISPIKNQNIPLGIDAQALSFSDNGEWMIANVPNYGHIRINMLTQEKLVFGIKLQYENGQSPNLRTAVSSDGRYALIGDASSGWLDLYDLSDCVPPVSIWEPANCKHKDIAAFLRSKDSTYFSAAQLTFIDNNNIELFAAYRAFGAPANFKQQILTANGETFQRFGYLALGDSFASGEGVFNYKPGTDVLSPLNKCHLSMSSYPYLLGKVLSLNQFESVACSGAKIKDVDFDYPEYKNDLYDEKGITNYRDKNKQAEGKDEGLYTKSILQNFEPGYRTQLRFVTEYKPSVITISMGGNDMQFSNIVRNCVFWFDDCYSQPKERAALVKMINDRFNELTTMYLQLKQESPGAKIYVLGYPNIVSTDGECKANVALSYEERKMAAGLLKYMNSVIEKATKKAGVSYIDVSNVLDGHLLCGGKDSVDAANGLTAGNDKVFDIGPFGNESYHPNINAQILYAQKIIDKTNSFTVQNPAPNPNESWPSVNDGAEFIGTQIKDLMDVFYIPQNLFEDAGDHLWYKNSPKTIQANGFAPGSPVSIWLTSDPLQLGNTTANPEGSVSQATSIPATVPAGYHTVHVSGVNLSGEKIEYQDQVFVAASETDLDGNSIPDTEQKCVGVTAANTDQDKDGIDDACDGFIDEAPLEPEEPETIPSDPGDNESSLDYKNGLGESSPELEVAPMVSGALLVAATQTSSTNSKPIQVSRQDVAIAGFDTSLSGSGVLNALTPNSSKPAPVNQKPSTSMTHLFWALAGVGVVSFIWLTRLWRASHVQ